MDDCSSHISTAVPGLRRKKSSASVGENENLRQHQFVPNLTDEVDDVQPTDVCIGRSFKARYRKRLCHRLGGTAFACNNMSDCLLMQKESWSRGEYPITKFVNMEHGPC